MGIGDSAIRRFISLTVDQAFRSLNTVEEAREWLEGAQATTAVAHLDSDKGLSTPSGVSAASAPTGNPVKEWPSFAAPVTGGAGRRAAHAALAKLPKTPRVAVRRNRGP